MRQTTDSALIPYNGLKTLVVPYLVPHFSERFGIVRQTKDSTLIPYPGSENSSHSLLSSTLF